METGLILRWRCPGNQRTEGLPTVTEVTVQKARAQISACCPLSDPRGNPQPNLAARCRSDFGVEAAPIPGLLVSRIGHGGGWLPSGAVVLGVRVLRRLRRGVVVRRSAREHAWNSRSYHRLTPRRTGWSPFGRFELLVVGFPFPGRVLGLLGGTQGCGNPRLPAG